MKLWKKILLVLLAVVLLAQIPFVYNRFQTAKLSTKINQLQTNRTNLTNPNFNEYKGVIHAHTSLGGHSTGHFDDLIGGANADDLDYVVMTEHYSPIFDTSALTLNGFYGKTLFVGGNEIDTADSDRFLMIAGGADAAKYATQKTTDVLAKIHESSQIAFVTYPEKFKSWDSNYDGIEVFSLHTNAKNMNPVGFLFNALWSFGSYPELTMAKYFARPDDNLRKYDEIAANRKITLFAGSDAHSNLGFHLLGDDAGNKIIGLKFDDYQTIFRLVRTHVLIEKDKTLTQESLIEALKNGHAFVGFDVLSDTSGFSFTAENGAESKIQGDEILLQNGVRLKAVAPQNARFVVYKNGEKVYEAGNKTEIVFDAVEKGAYRTEVYLDVIESPFDKMPWIFSNPIYVR
ncbi:MAG: hypothetical protein M3Q99_15815 [Acidobacteriota bacterium]|nr:hypothetical protein [Acidobacteriota bacterium]